MVARCSRGGSLFQPKIHRPIKVDSSKKAPTAKIHQEERAEEFRHPQVYRVLFHQPCRLHASNQDRQADRQWDEDEVIHGQ
jgi:hypothetical protein